MVQGNADSNRHAISTALFGLMVLTLGMGIGRFLYTPMLPVLLSEGQFTFAALSGLPAPTTRGIWRAACCSPSAPFTSLLAYGQCC